MNGIVQRPEAEAQEPKQSTKQTETTSASVEEIREAVGLLLDIENDKLDKEALRKAEPLAKRMMKRAVENFLTAGLIKPEDWDDVDPE